MSHPVMRWIRQGGLLLLALLAVSATAHGQSDPAEILEERDGGDLVDEDEREAFVQSLEQVISTLEDAERRGALIEDLKELQGAADETTEPDAVDTDAGLFGAISHTLDEVSGRTDEHTPLETWQQHLDAARDDVAELAADLDPETLFAIAADAGTLLAIWLAVLLLTMAAGRRITRLRGWPLELPNNPRGWMLAIYFLRHALPWAFGALVLLAAVELIAISAGHVIALLIAYVSLCGRAFALICELVIALFNRGHRRPAVAVIRRRGLPRLFLVGALAALANAMAIDRFDGAIGEDLAQLLTLGGNGLAAVITGFIILQLRRPVQHLIYNRPYPQRRESGSTNDILRLVSRLWHVPALLLILLSLIPVALASGDPEVALSRGLVMASLLVITIVVSRLISHHKERRQRRYRRITQYRERLETFGYALAQLVTWTVLAELSLWVWGGSLFGLGQEGIGAQMGQALLAVGLTALLAWLTWILTDTAIQRALTSTTTARGRRVNVARVQTITPMIRNVVFTAIVIIAGIVGLANLGVNVTPLLAGAGIIGIAIGFGAQTLVQDLITGLFILIEDSLAIDDFVDLGGQMGTVEGLSLRTVRLRDIDGILHIVPFSEIKAIHNMSRQFGVALIRINVPASMGVDDTMALIREVDEDMRENSPLKQYVRAPLEFQGVERFEDGVAVLRTRIHTKPEMQWNVSWDFNLRLKQRFEQEGIDLARGRVSVFMENGADSSRPETEPTPEEEQKDQPHTTARGAEDDPDTGDTPSDGDPAPDQA
ncbi:mechanosensitive ion channel family protein [Aquisalimonas asiatica]|uniref:Small-conductance mechanosensitive channel n=1 Tax=Aquisalimonas asiatica TaxID=406100 RepID=A0A1H8ULN5_9GAMM|nr:mechanosensitive ion channel family protein [Aquisalimonas asiatica]SEP03996.1 Small-conductance mechanosensitive channel [Aquisalimonas asiatica]